jgi:hypothetical protein
MINGNATPATCLIRPSSIRRLYPPRKPEDLPSNSRKLVMTVGGAARVACALALGAKPRPANAPAAPARMPRRERSRMIRRSADRTVGWQHRQPAAPASASRSVTQVNDCDLAALERCLPTSRVALAQCLDREMPSRSRQPVPESRTGSISLAAQAGRPSMTLRR